MKKLIEIKTGKELKPGDAVNTFRNEPATLVGYREPEHEGSSGKVTIRLEDGDVRSFYPSVIGATFDEQ